MLGLFSDGLRLSGGNLETRYNLFHSFRFPNRPYGVKQSLCFGIGFLHHAQPLLQAGDGVFFVGRLKQAQIDKQVYPA